MNYVTELKALAGPEEVFSTLYQYKIVGDPRRFFPSKLVKWNFQVLTDNPIGLGATYDWRIFLLRIPVLAFTEQVVEWQDGRSVAYQAISGWTMYFRVCLEPDGESTRVKVEIDFSVGNLLIDRMLRPFVEWGLEKVCRHGLTKEGIQTTENLNLRIKGFEHG